MLMCGSLEYSSDAKKLAPEDYARLRTVFRKWPEDQSKWSSWEHGNDLLMDDREAQLLTDLGLKVTAWIDSPIEGGDGNREFFVQACWPDPAAVMPAREARRVAHEADLAAKAYAKANDY